MNEDGYELADICECEITRRNEARIKRSGLGDTIKAFTFDTYATPNDWQKDAKEKAQRFLNDHDGKWFLVCGQVGAGKTHLCTAITGELIKRGINARYMRWRDAIDQLRAIRFNDEAYTKQMNKWKYTPIIYIDDFLKSDNLDAFEKNVAFSILDARWGQQTSVTIISSEHSIADLLKMDEATGSRIYQRTKDYGVVIPKNAKLNYRLYGDQQRMSV